MKYNSKYEWDLNKDEEVISEFLDKVFLSQGWERHRSSLTPWCWSKNGHSMDSSVIYIYPQSYRGRGPSSTLYLSGYQKRLAPNVEKRIKLENSEAKEEIIDFISKVVAGITDGMLVNDFGL